MITLKRFGYDNKTYQRVKLNDYFEFPLEIDMKKWTKESIVQKEENEIAKDLDDNFAMEDDVTETGHGPKENEMSLDDLVGG